MGGVFDVSGLSRSLELIEGQCSDGSLWGDPACARKLLRERSKVSKTLDAFFALQRDCEDCFELLGMVTGDDDDFLLEVVSNLEDLRKRVDLKKAECLFCGEADGGGCFLTIRSGAGGTESNDWVSMLLRMYVRWAEIQRKFKAEVIDRLEGEEVGFKSVTIRINGDNAYGWSKTESGIHRLVRISPFDSGARRHTSFASVEVSPIVEQDVDITVLEKDLRIDTYRASGSGGQHVNKTESAVRITHIPSGIVVQCQNNRSQHQNRAEAYDLLRSRLYEVELQEKEKRMAQEHSSKCDIGWGHQIRSYVMQPYRMVKDLRTGHEIGDVDSVLDGNLDSLIIKTLFKKFSHNSAGFP